MQSWGQEVGQSFVPRKERGRMTLAPEIYGYSTQKLPLSVFIPDNWPRPRALIIAGIHGEEGDTTNVLSYALRSISPKHMRNAVILCANPDGMLRAIRGNANDVDLNRNFPSNNWSKGVTLDRWEVNLPADVWYSTGSRGGSERETEALISFIEKNEVARIISLHSPLGCVDYEHPYDWPLARDLALRLQLPLVNDIGYPCPGSMDSWAKEGQIPLITLEFEGGLSLSDLRSKYGPVLQGLLTNKLG